MHKCRLVLGLGQQSSLSSLLLNTTRCNQLHPTATSTVLPPCWSCATLLSAGQTRRLTTEQPKQLINNNKPEEHIHQFTGIKYWIDQMIKAGGGYGLTKMYKSTINQNATQLYMCCLEYSSFDLFRKELGLDDTFQSWFSVLQLHTWLLMVRLHHCSTLPNDVKYLKWLYNQQLWNDVIKRMKKVATGREERTTGQEALRDLAITSWFGYDEGLLTNDITLAGALWRNLFNKDSNPAPEKIALMVDYVHKNLHHLRLIPDTHLLRGYVTFLPLTSDKLDPAIEEKVIKRLQSFTRR